ADPGRRSVFSAALQQSQELATAADVVGPATKPLPLFYALSQGGRAVAASRATDETWMVRGHGLSVETAESVAATHVERQKGGRDSFGVVAEATGSDDFDGTVALGALWASLPELDDA